MDHISSDVKCVDEAFLANYLGSCYGKGAVAASQEFLIFLRIVDGCVPQEFDVHIVMDNLGTHTQPDVKRWFARHPKFKLHFTPKGASWVNMVEAWFGNLTKKQIRRNSFGNVNEVIRAVNEFVETYQTNPRPFVWTANADKIIRKVAKLRMLQATGD